MNAKCSYNIYSSNHSCMNRDIDMYNKETIQVVEDDDDDQHLPFGIH